MDHDSTLDLDEDAITRLADIERIRVFNDRSITGALSAPLGIGLLGRLWCCHGLGACISLIEVAIEVVGLGCRRALAGKGNPGDWLRLHFILVAISGVVWGYVAWVAWVEGGSYPTWPR